MVIGLERDQAIIHDDGISYPDNVDDEGATAEEKEAIKKAFKEKHDN